MKQNAGSFANEMRYAHFCTPRTSHLTLDDAKLNVSEFSIKSCRSSEKVEGNEVYGILLRFCRICGTILSSSKMLFAIYWLYVTCCYDCCDFSPHLRTKEKKAIFGSFKKS